MKTNIIGLAAPIYFILIGLELYVARVRKRHVYRFADALTDIGCGTASQLAAVFLHVFIIGGYIFVYDHYRVFEMSAGSPWPWLIAFFGVDFFYYWWHRLSHEVSFLWAAHIVHHSSEDYNLAVALRQAVLTHITIAPFFLPLALLGIPPSVQIVTHAYNIMYQFWIHTQLIGKLGPVEEVLNTPSHHRVHHAINARYLDKNYAAILMLWDRLFGTFERETEAPVFGIVKPLASFNPLVAQFHYFREMLVRMRATRHPMDRLRVLFKSPAWMPPGVPGYPLLSSITPETFSKYDPRTDERTRLWVLVQLGIAIVGASVILLFAQKAPASLLALGSLLVLWTLVAAGGFFENRSWARPVETLRLVCTAAAAVVLALR